MDYKFTFQDGSEALMHHGVKGMKWGVWNSETRDRYEVSGDSVGGGLNEDDASSEENPLDTIGSALNDALANVSQAISEVSSAVIDAGESVVNALMEEHRKLFSPNRVVRKVSVDVNGKKMTLLKRANGRTMSWKSDGTRPSVKARQSLLEMVK